MIDDDGIDVCCACELPSINDQLYRLVSTQLGALFEWTLPSQTVTPIGYQHDHGVSAILGNAHVYISDCKDAGICMLDTHINCSLPWRAMISRSQNCLRQFHGSISSAVHGMALPKLGIIDLPVLSFPCIQIINTMCTSLDSYQQPRISLHCNEICW